MCELIEEARVAAFAIALDGRENTAVLIRRLADALERSQAERDEYAAVALAGLGGVVGTPEQGYIKDGGPGLLRADFRRLRELIGGLKAENERLRRELSRTRDERSRLFARVVLDLNAPRPETIARLPHADAMTRAKEIMSRGLPPSCPEEDALAAHDREQQP